jgi:ribose transport system substrate-binding protein
MKRHWFAVVLLATAGLMSACGSSSPGTSSQKVIGVSFYTNTIPLYAQIRQGMEAEAKAKGVQLIFSYANNDAGTQSSQIADFVTKKVNLILCSPVSVAALAPAYNQARQAGIPVISVANKVADANEDAFIGQDWSFVGRAQVDGAAKAFNSQAKIALITGPPVIDFVSQSVQGVKDELTKYPGLKIVAQAVDPDLSQNGGLDQANNILTAHPDVNAILASTDDIALGAVQALQEHHIALGKVFVAGLDGEPRAVDSIKNNQGLSFTISVKGVTWGKQSIDVAIDWLNGTKPSVHRVDSAYQIVDASNAASLTQDQLN